jgi:DNA-binding response OmpR family regulator
MTKIRILYLEDETSLGSITHDVLVKNGFHVDWAQDGRSALSLFRSKKFDVCIADIMLPGLDGYSFVKEIRKIDIEMPIIFLSARTLAEDVVKGFQVGADDYMRKPFTVEELIVRINSLLRRRPTTEIIAGSIFTIGKNIYKYDVMELQIGEKIITLTYRTNELIYRLMKSKNGVMDRRQTLLDLWGDDSAYNARSMDVFISKIRKYFQEDPNIKIINLRGLGYKMIIKE